MNTKIDTQEMLEQATLAEAAGFTKVAEDLRTKASRVSRMVQAYEFYRVVKQEIVDAFNAKLKAKTERPATEHDRMKLANPTAYYTASVIADQLVLDRLESYAGIPPTDVFAKVREAKERKIFDYMEVAHVQPVSTEVKLPDPIVFGRIDGCTDRFFICEWGDDVSIHDLLGPHGG